MSEKEFNQIFAANLKYQLEKNDMTQADLAAKLDCALSTVGYWCQAKKNPRMSKVDAMCEIFHCTRADLIQDISSEDKEREALMRRIAFAGGRLPIESLEVFANAFDAALKAMESN